MSYQSLVDLVLMTEDLCMCWIDLPKIAILVVISEETRLCLLCCLTLDALSIFLIDLYIMFLSFPSLDCTSRFSLFIVMPVSSDVFCNCKCVITFTQYKLCCFYLVFLEPYDLLWLICFWKIIILSIVCSCFYSTISIWDWDWQLLWNRVIIFSLWRKLVRILIYEIAFKKKQPCIAQGKNNFVWIPIFKQWIFF